MARLWLASNLLFVGSLALYAAAELTAPDGTTSLAILIVTVLVAVPAFLSLLLHIILDCRIHKEEEDNDDDAISRHRSRLLPSETEQKLLRNLDNGLRPSAQSVALFIAPSISLFFVLLLRLVVDMNNFEGNPSILSYGWKDGIADGEDNIAFTNEFNSYGHCIQGVLAAILNFPAISGLVTQFLTCHCKHWWAVCNKPLWSLVQLIGACMTIYPSYNLVKRFVRTGDTFATSSFCNNSFEWASGFMIGLAFGNLVTVMVKTIMTNKLYKAGQDVKDVVESNDGESWVFGTQRASGREAKIRGIQFLLGVLLTFSVFASAVLFGITWHNCLDEGDDCVNYSDDGIPIVILTVLVLVPSVVIIGASCGECMRLRRDRG